MTSFQQGIQRNCPTSYPKGNPEEEDELPPEQVHEVSQYRVIYSPLCAPVLPHFPRIPIRIVRQVDLNMQRH